MLLCSSPPHLLSSPVPSGQGFHSSAAAVRFWNRLCGAFFHASASFIQICEWINYKSCPAPWQTACSSQLTVTMLISEFSPFTFPADLEWTGHTDVQTQSSRKNMQEPDNAPVIHWSQGKGFVGFWGKKKIINALFFFTSNVHFFKEVNLPFKTDQK